MLRRRASKSTGDLDRRRSQLNTHRCTSRCPRTRKVHVHMLNHIHAVYDDVPGLDKGSRALHIDERLGRFRAIFAESVCDVDG